MSTSSLLRNMAAMAGTLRMPSRRAIAALAKLHGRRVERRWPFFPRPDSRGLNLDFDDVLELQFARRPSCRVLVVGAYDGLANDPLARFITSHPCQGIFVEPQAQAFERLRTNLGGRREFEFVKAAIDEQSSTREFFEVDTRDAELPAWTAQLASFDRAHIEKHEARAPGVTARIRSREVQTYSFADLLDRFAIRELDVLQIDAEGFDARLLRWFPFGRVKPGVVHYEVAHMSGEERRSTRALLESFGYRVLATSSAEDEMAVAL